MRRAVVTAVFPRDDSLDFDRPLELGNLNGYMELRLRQKCAGMMHDHRQLLQLLAESVSTFCVLTRHALRLHGIEARWTKREIVEQAVDRFGIDPEPFTSLLDLREEEVKPKQLKAAPLYSAYLLQINRVVEHVDGLEK